MKPFSNICELEDNVQEINIHEEVTFEASDKNENATTTTIEGPHDLLLQAWPKVRRDALTLNSFIYGSKKQNIEV